MDARFVCGGWGWGWNRSKECRNGCIRGGGGGGLLQVLDENIQIPMLVLGVGTKSGREGGVGWGWSGGC